MTVYRPMYGHDGLLCFHCGRRKWEHEPPPKTSDALVVGPGGTIRQVPSGPMTCPEGLENLLPEHVRTRPEDLEWLEGKKRSVDRDA